jgi:hypothetical protein
MLPSDKSFKIEDKSYKIEDKKYYQFKMVNYDVKRQIEYKF